MARIRTLTVAILALFLSGCADSAGTPEQAVSKFFQALVDAEYNDAYSMLSAADRESLQQELQRLADGGESQELTTLNEQFGLNLSPSDLRAMSAQEFFAKTIEAARKADKKLEVQLSQPPKVLSAQEATSHNSATVQLRFSGGHTKMYRCVRDGNNWRVKYGQ